MNVWEREKERKKKKQTDNNRSDPLMNAYWNGFCSRYFRQISLSFSHPENKIHWNELATFRFLIQQHRKKWNEKKNEPNTHNAGMVTEPLKSNEI